MFKIFQQSNGNPSMIRVLAFIIVLVGVYLVIKGVQFVENLNPQGTAVVLAGTALFPVALGFKTLQKKQEGS